MKVFGVVAEFNPFHNGHFHLLNEARKAGCSHCVAVMSGNFVQRGEPAVTEKRVRAQAALNSGVDLIIELPVACAVAPAQRFAKSAVSLLQAAGCVNAIAFGSESGNIAVMRKAVAKLDKAGHSQQMKELLAQGYTFAKAQALAFEYEYGKDIAKLLCAPNNVLGIEYLRAADELNWAVDALTFPREGAAHDAEIASDNMASASYLRERSQNFDTLAKYVPQEAAKLYRAANGKGFYPLNYKQIETVSFSYLRRLSREDLRNLPDLSEGIEDRLWKAIRAAKSYEEMLILAKTKRYTLARIRRLALCAFLGIRAEDAVLPPYLRVLGANEKGRELLTIMRKTAKLPLESSLARLRKNEACQRFAELEAIAGDLYTAALPQAQPCGYDYTEPAVFL